MEETFTIQLQEDGRRLKDLGPIGWGFRGVFGVGLVEDCKKGYGFGGFLVGLVISVVKILDLMQTKKQLVGG